MKLIKSNSGLVLVFILSILPLLGLLHPGLPLTHDGQDHVARIANFYQSLSEGNIVPRWAGNLNWGFGHPILMFLYPLPSYITSFFHFLGFSIIDSIKVFFAASFILSGIFMYLWVKDFLGEGPALAASIAYNFAPYRFVDLYVRGAIGEHAAFVFPPLILFLLLKISKSKIFNKFLFASLTLSITGLLLAHNALSLMFLPFIFLYSIYLILNSKFKNKLSIQLLFAFLLGVGLSAFFLIPAFAEGKYTLRDIVTENIALSRFVELKDLISGSWGFGQTGQFSVEIGWFILLSFILGPLIFYWLKQKKESTFVYSVAFLFFAMSVFIMLPISKPVWQIFTTLQKFQFPWRFLSLSVFTGAILVGFMVNFITRVFKNSKLAVNIFISGIILFVILTTVSFWQPKGYLTKPESFFTNVYDGTTDTGESSPIWSIRFMEKRSKNHAEVISGNAQIKEVFRNTTKHSYEIDASLRSRIRENTLYFPGWSVYIDGKENLGIQFQDPTNRGLITYYIPSGKHTVDVIFKNTKLRTLAEYISVASFAVVVLIMIKGGIIFK